MKLIVIGLDGASYSLIVKFCQQGYLPTFKKIISEGKFGPLCSTIPPHTAPGWVSSLTGVEPGEHGVFQFWDTQSDNYVGKFMGSTDVEYPFVWDVLNSNGYSTGIINVPMTHPPKKINGYIITWPLSNTLRYSYPHNLIREIAQNNGHYVSDLLTMFTGDENYINEAILITKKRLKTILYLMKEKPTDFIMAVFTEIDRVSHFYWQYMHDKNKKIDAVKKIYIETDLMLKELLENLEQQTQILIYSDHGFEKGILDFYVQKYLIDNNFMKLKEAPNNYKLAGNWYELQKEDGLYVVDWENTIAYMPAPGAYGININLKNRQICGIVDESKYNNICDELIKILSEIRNPLDGSLLFESVKKREDVYNGKKVQYAPDLILIPSKYGIMVHHKITNNMTFNYYPEQKGMHSMEGVIMLYGSEIHRIDKLPQKIEEVAMLILKFYNAKMPKNTNDKVKHHDCDEQKELNFIEIHNSYNEDEEESIKEKLKKLGYY